MSLGSFSLGISIKFVAEKPTLAVEPSVQVSLALFRAISRRLVSFMTLSEQKVRVGLGK